MRNDYLCHRDHKYISKEFVKGTWRYLYNYGLGAKAYKDYKNSNKEVFNAYAKYNDSKNDLKKVMMDRDSTPLDKHSAIRSFSNDSRKYAEAKRKSEEALEKYKDTPLYKLDYLTNKGLRTMNRITKKIESTKNTLLKNKNKNKPISKSVNNRPRSREKNVTNNGTGIKLFKLNTR